MLCFIINVHAVNWAFCAFRRHVRSKKEDQVIPSVFPPPYLWSNIGDWTILPSFVKFGTRIFSRKAVQQPLSLHLLSGSCTLVKGGNEFIFVLSVFVLTQTRDKDTFGYTRWSKYDRDNLWLVYTQIVPVIFEPPCIKIYWIIRICYSLREN
jgi:hypothetical protein